MSAPHYATSISPNGKCHKFRPTLAKGCQETRSFAHESNQDVANGGVSIVISSKPTMEALWAAEHLIVKMKEALKHET
jgi:hypothetical protein